MIELSGNVINKYKLIHAYFKKENIDFSESDKYFEMSMKDLRELIQSKYDIKIMDWKHMENAKKVGHELSEYDEQRLLVKWLRDNKIPCSSSGNGFSLDTRNNVQYMAKLKASGLSVGYPDLDVFIGNGISLHIEMKREKGGTVSAAQEKWVTWFNNNGYKAKVCYGFKEAKKYVIEECKKINKNLI